VPDPMDPSARKRTWWTAGRGGLQTKLVTRWSRQGGVVNHRSRVARMAVSAMVLVCAGNATAETPQRQLTNPYWLRQPSAENISNAFLAYGRDYKSLHGQISMFCTIAKSGQLSDCLIPGTPMRDDAFKKATLSLAPFFETKTHDSVGEDVVGPSI
jgi:hypothetical protein